VKALRSQKLRMLHHSLLQSKAIAVDNDLRGTLCNVGFKVGMVGTARNCSRTFVTWRYWLNRC
jgi:hypothetical protein